MGGSGGYIITRAAQIEALVSPVRQEIVDVVQASGACSAGEIAGLLGRPQDGLYYHLRLLVRVGLLCEVETRATGRREEAVYDVPGRPLRLAYRPGEARNARGVRRIVGAMLRMAGRNFDAAMGRPGVVVEGASRGLWAARVKGWLTDAQVREVNRHLRAIERIAHGSRRRRGAGLHELTFVLVPLEPRERRRDDKGELS